MYRPGLSPFALPARWARAFRVFERRGVHGSPHLTGVSCVVARHACCPVELDLLAAARHPDLGQEVERAAARAGADDATGGLGTTRALQLRLLSPARRMRGCRFTPCSLGERGRGR